MKTIGRILSFLGICALIGLASILSVRKALSKSTEKVLLTKYFSKAPTSNITLSTGLPREEVRHIVFLKVHKAASSTLMNTFYRFGHRRRLSFLMNRKGNYLKFRSPLIPAKNDMYDILANHVLHFDYKRISSKMPADSVYIAVVREPLPRLYSAFTYYKHYFPGLVPYLMTITGENPFEKYCLDPERYDKDTSSVTNNILARDFGYDRFQPRESAGLQSYLFELDTIFRLVLVVEYMDESLVLMRRMLNWSIKDVVYMAGNTSPDTRTMNISQAAKASVTRFLHLDYNIYNHFLAIFKDKMNMEIEIDSFKEEVIFFKSINTRIQEYCTDALRREMLYIEGSQWSEDFYVSTEDCTFMQMESTDFINFIRRGQLKRIANNS